MPATFARMSMPPMRAATCSTACSTCAITARSTWKYLTVRPAPRKAAAVSWPGWSLRSKIATEPWRSANSRAVACPMPEAPPVTTITLFVKSMLDQRAPEPIHRLRQTRHLIAQRQILHRQITAEAGLLNGLVNIRIVHLARAGIVASGIIRHVEDGHLGRGFGQRADDVPLLHLLVIEIEQQPHLRIVHLADQLESFGACRQKEALVVDERIERLHNHGELGLRGQVARALGAFQQAGVLLFVRTAGDGVAAHQNDLRDLQLPREADGVAHVRQESIAVCGIDHRYRTLAPVRRAEQSVHAQPE